MLQTVFQLGADPRCVTTAEAGRPFTLEAGSRLVLSLFPGCGLLDRGFELEGWTVLRGPDVLFGQRIEDFKAEALRGHIAGVIGGPPCQDFSRARRRPPTGHGLKMLAEYCRVVTEAEPEWFLMENVPQVPTVALPGWVTQRFNLFASEFGIAQRRNRSFQFGYRTGPPLVILSRGQSQPDLLPAVLARDGRRNFADLCELQGLPRRFDLPGLSRTAKYRAVGNGVPVPVGRAVAAAIRERGSITVELCPCGCGRPVTGRQKSATVACRKRLERSRKGLVKRLEVGSLVNHTTG